MPNKSKDGLTPIEWTICRSSRNEEVIILLYDNNKDQQSTIIQRLINKPWLFVCLVKHDLPDLFDAILSQTTDDIINYQIKENDIIFEELKQWVNLQKNILQVFGCFCIFGK